jgi:hypothetical protein
LQFRVPSLASNKHPLFDQAKSADHLLVNDDVVPLPKRLAARVDEERQKGSARARNGTPTTTRNDLAALKEPGLSGTSGGNRAGSDTTARDNHPHRKPDVPKSEQRSAPPESGGPETSDNHKENGNSARRESRAIRGVGGDSSGTQHALANTPSASSGGLPEAGSGSTPPAENNPKDRAKPAIAPNAVQTGPKPVLANNASAITNIKKDRNGEHRGPLAISELRLCRSIAGFGSFEPLKDERVKAGQSLLVYCELNGLQYEVRDGGFVSRISSRVELKSTTGGPVVWAQELGDAEDKCRRRRRDYYVNYFVDLPKFLEPGAYRVRLLQTDLVAGCSVATDIPIEITP